MDSAPADQGVHIRLLRDPSLQLGSTPPQPLNRKDAALLGLLALDGVLDRDLQAAWLWPGAPSAQARNNLRQRRFRLARMAGRALVEGDGRLRLADGVGHDALALDHRLEQDPQALDDDWLAGLNYLGSPDLQAWLDAARERWRVLRSQALTRVASRLEEQARIAPALLLAERLVRDEPLSDHAQRRLMRLHHLRGDLGAAMASYQRFAARLAQELGEMPDDETAALAAQLRLGQAGARVAAPLPPTLARPPRMVGRDVAWQALGSALAARECMVIEAAPGLGKTRLLADATQHLAAVVSIAAQSGDQARPYALLGRLLESCAAQASAQRQLRSALPAWARSELACLLPEFGPAAARVDPLRLQLAIGLVLRTLAPALVVADDVQEADAASLELLPALVAAPGQPPWWLAVRSGEHPPALAAWLAASESPGLLSLAPLTAAEVRSLLGDLALAQAPDAALLWRHTGGNPLFILETLRSLHGRAELQWDHELLPPRAAQRVRARAARLPEHARQLAQAAAVLRQPLALEDAQPLLAAAGVDWPAAFQALEQAQWLDAGGRMHDLVSAALRDAMPAAQRRWLHGRAAQWLLARAAPPLVCAQHLQAAGRDAEAAPLFEAAALQARRSARPADEASLWVQACDAWERAGRHEPACRSLREAIMPRLFAEGATASWPLVHRLQGLARSTAQRLGALNEAAMLHLSEGQIAQALPAAREAQALARQVGDEGELILTTSTLAQCLSYQDGAAAEALALMNELQPLAARAPRALRLHALEASTQVLYRSSRLADCVAALRQTLEMAVEDENWREADTLGGNLALLLGNLGRYEEAWGWIELADGWRERLGGTVAGHILAGKHLQRGHILLGLGRPGAAIAAYRQALLLYADSTLAEAWPASAESWLAAAWLLVGDSDAAAAVLQRSDPPLPAYQRGLRAALRAEVASARGQDPAAWLDQAWSAVRDSGDKAAMGMVQASTAWLDGGARDPQRLLEIETGLRAVDQRAQATRLAWWRVDALLQRGELLPAAALARRLLAGDEQPFLMLPRTWLQIAQAALAAADAPQAAELQARRDRAQGALLADMAEHGIGLPRGDARARPGAPGPG